MSNRKIKKKNKQKWNLIQPEFKVESESLKSYYPATDHHAQ